MSQEKMPFIRELYEGFVKSAVLAVLEQLDQSIEWVRPRTTSMRIASPQRTAGVLGRYWSSSLGGGFISQRRRYRARRVRGSGGLSCKLG